MAARSGRAMCSKCGSYDTLPSRKHAAMLDSLMGMFGKRPYRCHACRGRFYSRDPEMEPEGRDAAYAAAREPDQREDAGAPALNVEPQPAASGEPSKPRDELLKDWPARPVGDQREAGLSMDPVKVEEPRDARIQGGAGKSGGVTAAQPAPDAGDAEKRRAAPPAPGWPEETGDAGAGEVPSVQELLSRVDRAIESTRAQKGPDAQVAARPDESGASAPREALLSRMTRALRPGRKRPAEKDRRGISVR